MRNQAGAVQITMLEAVDVASMHGGSAEHTAQLVRLWLLAGLIRLTGNFRNARWA